jgi:acyl-CoA reductase-like NAD-dependent aldehyde dehydrogenase
MMATTAPTRARPLFLAGAEVPGDGVAEVQNPYDGELVGRVTLATRQHVDRALERATEAFRDYRSVPAYVRHEILTGAAAAVERRREELAALITAESGKPIRDARVEVERDVFTLRYAGEEAIRRAGEVVPLDLAERGRGRFGIVRRFPIGPVLAITPFNTPLNLVAHKVAPALAVGNPVLVKPALETPLVALELAAVLRDAGVPDGMLSVLPLSNELAEASLADPRLAGFSFTGSTRTGWHLRQVAPRKRAMLELGGNAGVIVHSDADVSLAAAKCVGGAFNYAGQSCTSVQRVYVHRDIWDDFTSKVRDLTVALVLGDPADETTDIGPMITAAAAVQAEARVGRGVDAGATLLCGGRRDGAMLEPTVLVGVRDEMEVVCEEVFAPVLSLVRYDRFEDAVNRVNDTPLGLQAGLFTQDIDRILYAYDRLEVGGVMANEVAAFRIDHMPYGGMKESGVGREGLRYAMRDMTEEKLLMLGAVHQS